jgi:hypothetical protein
MLAAERKTSHTLIAAALVAVAAVAALHPSEAFDIARQMEIWVISLFH